MRYERKYRVTESDYDRILHHLMSNPVGFDFSFPNRVVNSIYYDDINFTSFNDNVIGNACRVKYRVRWYGKDLDYVEDPVLEKKIKINLLGNKEYQSMESFSLGHTWPDVNSKLSTNYLYPLVIVQYDRTYLESADHSIRATIDRDLHYYRITNNEIAFPSHRDNGLIIEIKYDQQSEDYAAHCMQYIPYRMTKNSKYVSAMQYYLL